MKIKITDEPKIKLPANDKLPAGKKRSRENTTQKLLDAGLKVFSKYGYDAATTKLVAKESGVNESLIHRYFNSKEGLLHSLIESFFQKELVQGFQTKLSAGQTLEQVIFEYCSLRLDLVMKYKDFYKVVIYKLLVDQKLQDRMTRSSDGTKKILIDRLIDFQKNGIIREDVNPARAAFAINMMNFSTCTFGYVVLGFTNKEILKNIAEFARDYAAGLTVKKN